MVEGDGGGPTFKSTPSWIIGVVVFLLVAVSWSLEKLLSYLGNVLKRKDKKPLYKALQKIKEELMLMGFVTMLVAFVQDKNKGWCISEALSQAWLPCHPTDTLTATSHFQSFDPQGRLLAEDAGNSICKEGKVPFISLGVLHDLHYLIFILALVHVISCTLTILLGEVKISQWKKWEDSIRNQVALDNDRNDEFIDIRSLTFVKNRFQGVDAKKRHYVYSFFKHLAGVVTKADYEAMRLGFILANCNRNQRFNFHKYMVYAYEADFEKVVSISWFLWVFAAVSLSFNVAGWNIYYWLSFIPLFILLVVGTKLEQVITDLAIYVAQRHTIIVGEIQLQPSDDYFWFNKPKIILLSIHTILFMNSFGFTIFFWTLVKFKFSSCVMGDPVYAIARLLIIVVVQAICSYSTLPLYAIVTQMGSSFNKEAMLRYSYTSTHSGRVPEPSSAATTIYTHSARVPEPSSAATAISTHSVRMPEPSSAATTIEMTNQ